MFKYIKNSKVKYILLFKYIKNSKIKYIPLIYIALEIVAALFVAVFGANKILGEKDANVPPINPGASVNSTLVYHNLINRVADKGKNTDIMHLNGNLLVGIFNTKVLNTIIINEKNTQKQWLDLAVK